jgi:hypothetical protein
MVTLFASLVGFCSSIFPELLKISRDRMDKRHELAMLEIQIEMQKLLNKESVDYIDTFADIAEARTLHKSYYSNNPVIEALNSSVRPILAYSFFFLYGVVKFLKFFIIKDIVFFEYSFEVLWSQEDQAIFATIISFYFGQRALMKFRGKK